MSTPREGLSATLMDNGRVLIAGGSNGERDLASTEYFEAGTRAFMPGPAMESARRGHLAFRIPNNNTVVIAGGSTDGEPSAAVSEFAWWSNEFRGGFRQLGPLSAGRTQMDHRGYWCHVWA